MPKTTARVPFMVVLPRAVQRSLDVVRAASITRCMMVFSL